MLARANIFPWTVPDGRFAPAWTNASFVAPSPAIPGNSMPAQASGSPIPVAKPRAKGSPALAQTNVTPPGRCRPLLPGWVGRGSAGCSLLRRVAQEVMRCQRRGGRAGNCALRPRRISGANQCPLAAIWRIAISREGQDALYAGRLAASRRGRARTAKNAALLHGQAKCAGLPQRNVCGCARRTR